MTTPIGPLELVAGPHGLRAVLWPGEDGCRVARASDLGTVRLQAGSPRSAGSERPGREPRPGESAGVAAPRHTSTRPRCSLPSTSRGPAGTFDLDLDPAGTDFQLRAWRSFARIPYGRTISYGEQAAAARGAGAARAVGAANGRNPLSIVVPCHRVVAASGALTGFAGGLDIKAWLLDHERAVLAGR